METSGSFDAAAARSQKRWTATLARQVLAALAASGLSRQEFADKYGIHEQRLYNWQRRLVEAVPSADVQFREVTVPAASPDVRFELVLPSGLILRIPPVFDAGVVARLLEVLGHGR